MNSRGPFYWWIKLRLRQDNSVAKATKLRHKALILTRKTEGIAQQSSSCSAFRRSWTQSPIQIFRHEERILVCGVLCKPHLHCPFNFSYILSLEPIGTASESEQSHFLQSLEEKATLLSVEWISPSLAFTSLNWGKILTSCQIGK